MPVGDHLREWRRRRRMSQLELACEAEVSTRHLSFVETGRAVPSRSMILHLSEALAIPLRERNSLLLAAGFAPVFGARDLDDPALAPARAAVDLVLKGHEPHPALAIDRLWNLVASNSAVAPLMVGIDAELLSGTINVMRLALHPGGLAPRILNFGEWRAHLLARLRQQIAASGDDGLVALLEEMKSYPTRGHNTEVLGPPQIAVRLQLASPQGPLSFLSTTTIFGSPVDITLSELAIESFFPADAETAKLRQALSATRSPQQ